ncbi:MAG TPA: hypothetical protein VN179_05485, partial [Solirubrobacterales bacterium]|nr:hypothetical protein [Solirubrobacterales bacterium]
DALQSAVGNDIPYLDDPDPCERQADGSWRCTRWDEGFSGTIAYRVEVDWKGCWHATRAQPSAEGARKRLSGCLALSDFVF